MQKILRAQSTLTTRYQTTIPEPIRQALHLEKSDKISYAIDEQGNVLISKAESDDPVLAKFLDFIAEDINENPSHVKSVSSGLYNRAQSLVSDVDVDLEGPLSSEDE